MVGLRDNRGAQTTRDGANRSRSELAVSTNRDRNRDRIPWGWVIATTLGLEVLAGISAFVWVAIYSWLIHPGEDEGFYRNYAQYASPVVSIVAGTPYWYFGCRWVSRKAGNRAVAMSLWAWSILLLINVPLTFLSETPAFSWTMVAISHSLKLVAAYLGGKSALASHKRAKMG